MRVLFDLNVLLDYFLRRPPHYETAAAVIELVDAEEVVGIVGATPGVALRPLLERAVGSERAATAVNKVLGQFEVRSIGRAALDEALSVSDVDYHDAVLLAAARHGRADAVVTRNPESFGSETLPILTPVQLLDRQRVGGTG